MDTRLREIANFFLALNSVAEFNPRVLGANLLKHIFVLDIKRDTASAAVRLHIHLTGTALDHRFNRSVTGHFLDDFGHGPNNSDVLKGFLHCANTKEPVWMRQTVRTSDKPTLFVEGVGCYVEPERIYGGLLTGYLLDESPATRFDFEILPRT
jgi:hypothetical protein